MDTNKQTFRTGGFNDSDIQESTIQQQLKKSEEYNSALEARISKFINSSSMRSKRKQEWSLKKQMLGIGMREESDNHSVDSETLIHPDRPIQVNAIQNRRAVTSMEESSALVDTSEQTYLDYNQQLKPKGKPNTLYTHTVSYINTGESNDQSELTQQVKRAYQEADDESIVSQPISEHMDCTELVENKVATLEMELQRKLQMRDQKLKEFAARRTQERLQMIEDCESS